MENRTDRGFPRAPTPIIVVYGEERRPKALTLTNLSTDSDQVHGTASRDYVTDAIGNVIALSDGSGAVQTSYTYEPFGTFAASGASTTNSFAYTSRENDGTGLFYYRARYYDPRLQRFISEDPKGLLGGDNVYRYVANSPINAADPLGLDLTVTRWPGAGGFGHVGVGINTSNTQGFYPRSQSFCLVFGCSVNGRIANDQGEHPGVTPEIITIRTTPYQDAVLRQILEAWLSNPGNYNFYGRNCTDLLEDLLRALGLNPPDTSRPGVIFPWLKPFQNIFPVIHGIPKVVTGLW